MPRDTRSGRKVIDEEGTSSIKKLVDSKGTSTSRPGVTDSLSSRSFGAKEASRKMLTPPSNTRKSERLEKQTPLMTPVERKPVKDEKLDTQSPLRRSERGKKDPLISSESRCFAEESNSSEANRKNQRGKNLNELHEEEKEVGVSRKNDQEVSGVKRRRFGDARSFRAQFKSQKIKEATSDDSRRKDAPSVTDCVISQLSASKLMEPRDKEVDNRVREPANGTLEECSKRSENRSGKLVSSPQSPVAIISRAVGEVELSNSRSRGSSEPPVMKPSVTSDVVGKTLADNTCFGAEVSPNLEIVDSDCLASTEFNAPKKSNQSIDSRNVDPICDVTPSVSEFASPSTAERYHCIVGTCGKCSKRLRLKHDSPEEELCSCNGAKDPEANASLRAAEKLGNCDKLIGSPGDHQMGCHDKVCYVCRKEGDLLYCHGMSCENCYHISCLDPPLVNVQPMVWHCISCVEKKIRSGVHSVSKGVEEIWASRGVVISDSKGKHLQKQYLVKYQGLSHVHNHWVPEIMLHSEVSHLVDRFIQNQQQGLRWNLEWTVPHRLLKKRSLRFPEHKKSSSSNSDSITSCCNYEWLVKWCNLGYEQATWELEDADFLQSSLGEKLIKEYDLRTDKVKSVVDKHCEGSYMQMTKLPSGGSTTKDRSMLNNVNKLREFWYKYQNAIVFDDQDRVISSIFFILSLVDIGHPFFIIASPDAVSHWETEFTRVAPSVDFVVYAGNEETRRSIRALEFYEEGSRVIPQVLLASSEAAIEDVHLLKDLRWGAILIDELDARASTHLEQIRVLTTNSRVILFASQLKDRVPDYFGVLSLLDCRDSSKGGGVKCEDNIIKLKEQLSRYMPYGCIAEPSKFVEYWVPAQISNLQLEQYCATLLSNSMYLRTSLKNDLVGAVREILSTIKKCCDHPYLVDSTLQGSILKTLPPSDFLDVGIKASGKLQLLDMILSEIKARQLRVLILFQPIVGSAMPIGDILEDFVRQRFGLNTYERIDTHVAKKQAVLNRFNKKEIGQFVFLLEKGACGSIIKLTSVDTVVMFDSDWNPGNDLRALQKISIDSQFPQIKVFRLYSACTIEEKALILAKQDIHLDYNLQNISRSNTDTLLSWGASNLFNRLEEFHSSKSRTVLVDIAGDDLFANNVLSEVQATLTGESESKDPVNSLLAKAQQLNGIYCTNFPLLGESKIQSACGEEALIFWKNLLEGRNPCWRYPCPMTRNRKRGQIVDGSSKKQDMENDLVKKRRKVIDNGVNPSTEKEPAAGPGIRDANQPSPVSAIGGGLSCPSPSSINSHENIDLPERNKDQSAERLISNGQKGVHVYLISELEKLCEILALKEDIKHILHAFLGYVAENHRVSKENVAIFQALQISLCWIAASILKKKIDRRDSLLLAKQKLNFECSDEQAESVYQKLRMLKKTFLQQPNIIMELQALINPTSTEEHVLKGLLDAETLEPAHSRSESQETAHEENLTDLEHEQEHRSCNHKSETKSMSMLLEKQQEEIDEFHKCWEKERLLLENKKSVEAAVIRQIHKQISKRTDMLKMSDAEFSRKLEEHKKSLEAGLKVLKEKHVIAITEMSKKASNNLRSEADTLLNGCFDTAKEEVGCVVRLETGSAPAAPTSEGTEVTAPGSTYVLRNRETHEKQPSASNIVDHDYVCKGIDSGKTAKSNGEHPDKLFSGEANESVFADVPEDGHKEVRSTDDPDTNASVIQSIAANDGEDIVVGSETPDLVDNQINDANGTDHSSDQVALVAQQHEVIDSGNHAISAPSRQATTDELLQCAMSTEVQGECRTNQDHLSQFVESIESENVSQQVTTRDLTAEEGVASTGSTDDGPASEPNHPTCFEQQPLSMEHLPLVPEADGSVCQILNDGCTPLQATETTHQIEKPPNYSQHQPQVRENLGISSSSDIGIPNVANTQHSLPPVNNQGGEPTSAVRSSLRRVDDGSAQRTNRVVLQAGNHLGLYNSNQIPHADPFQIELEKLRKETEQATKVHENLKSQLRSDCEKEIAEIRSKYEAKVQDAEAIFQQKRKTLDTNVNKVLLNKILADAVNTKCIDVRPPSGVWRQQGFMQQLQQIPLQPARRPSNVGSSSASSTPAPQQNTSLPSEHRSASPSVGASCRPPIISSISGPQTSARVGADVRSAAPHLQSVVAEVRAAAPRLQSVGADIRSAAPHLQPFRPPVSVPAPNHSSHLHSVATQPFSANQRSLTLPSQVRPVQLREPLSQQPSTIQPSESSPRIPHTLPLPQMSSSHITPSETQRVGPASFYSSHPSAQELLIDIHRRFNALRPSPSVSPVVLESNVSPMSQSAMSGGMHGGLTSNVASTDVVYLSDDE